MAQTLTFVLYVDAIAQHAEMEIATKKQYCKLQIALMTQHKTTH